MLIPRQKTPDLQIDTLNHGAFDLAQQPSERGTVICFYRGLHCPICARYLGEMEKLAEKFAARGIDMLALSTDGEDRTRDMAEKVGATRVKFGYDLSLSKAREWGLYLSRGRGKTSIGIEEPALFAEPGLFLVNPDQTLFFASVQTMPFVRPHFSELLGAVDFAIEKNYPARGEYTGPV